MIKKDENFKNRYILTKTSTGDEFVEIWKSYEKIHCLICNRETAKRFKPSFWAFGQTCLTINNSVSNNVFYINSIS